jgi:hypothetical protein
VSGGLAGNVEVDGEGLVQDQAAIVDDRYSPSGADPPEGFGRGIERGVGGAMGLRDGSLERPECARSPTATLAPARRFSTRAS